MTIGHSLKLLFSFMLLSWFYSGCGPKEQPSPSSPADTSKMDTSKVVIAADTAWPRLVTDMVIYEVNMRAQGAAGTFASFLPQLDSIKSLGANVLWFMPLHPIGQLRSVGQLGSPYAVRDYKAVSAEYGTMAEFKELVNQAHKRKMCVVMDWVGNHTAWDNSWIGQHPDWYTQNAAGQIQIPAGTNWQDVADLNYGNAAMRLAMIDAMKFWLTEADVDGFRCDAADLMPFDFFAQMLESLKQVPSPRPRVWLAEGERADHITAGFQMVYAWYFYTATKDIIGGTAPASNIFISHRGEYSNMGTTGQRLRFTTNHDITAWEDTPPVFYGGLGGAMAASAAAICLGGVPLIYNGQEVGCPTKLPLFSKSTIDWAANPAMRQFYKGLLRARKAHPALRQGSLQAYPNTDVIAFTRTAGTDKALVLINARNRPINYTLPTEIANTVWKAQGGQRDSLGTQMTLRQHEVTLLFK